MVIKEKEYESVVDAVIPYRDTTYFSLYIYDTIERVTHEIHFDIDTIKKTIYLTTYIRNKHVELPEGLVPNEAPVPKKVKIKQNISQKEKEVNQSPIPFVLYLVIFALIVILSALALKKWLKL
jgi:hypothetical protein